MALPPNPWGGRQRLRVGLLGGSFNPAHDGHLHVAETALVELGLDQVWLLVSPQNPLKPIVGMAPLAQRLATLKAILGSNPRLIATDIERALGTTATVDTLAKLKRRFPNIRFVWIMGADNLLQMARWHRWTRLFQAVPVAILARAPYSWKACSAKAAIHFKTSRLRDGSLRGLANRRPPAWVFRHSRLHPASATAIRNERTRP